MKHTTQYTHKVYDHSKVTPQHLVTVWENLHRRLMKLAAQGKIVQVGDFSTGAHFYSITGKKGVTISSTYGWDNYNKDNERYYVHVSASFYALGYKPDFTQSHYAQTLDWQKAVYSKHLTA